MFLHTGIVVETKGRVLSENQTFSARGEPTWGGTPLVILVNHGTAAGSEIVAAALQVNKRAVIIGAPTFGRGTIQTIFPIGEQAALRLTTTRAYSPAGSPIEMGVQPDVAFDADRAGEALSPSDPAQDPAVAAALRILPSAEAR